MESLTRGEFRKFVIWWDTEFPIDYWWRRLHGVSFGSSQHREASFLDMLFEYEETKLMERSMKAEERRKADAEDYFMTGKWLKRSSKTSPKKEVDSWFENFDLREYNNLNNG